jgi:type II secretory pathway pseudopilin PulG
MRNKANKSSGFSLTEVLLAVGTLAIGMIFVAGVFPAAILLSTQSTERTTAAVVANEAFAKVRLIAGDPLARVYPSDFLPNKQLIFEEVANDARDASPDPMRNSDDLPDADFAYPSSYEINPNDKQYFWSAICRRTDADSDSPVQVTVFVCRRSTPSAWYWVRHHGTSWSGVLTRTDRPGPVYIEVERRPDPDKNQLEIRDLDSINPTDEASFVDDGSVILDDITGRLYRVLNRDDLGTVTLDSDWVREGRSRVWVVPPPAGGGRYPCIAVFQKVIRF